MAINKGKVTFWGVTSTNTDFSHFEVQYGEVAKSGDTPSSTTTKRIDGEWNGSTWEIKIETWRGFEDNQWYAFQIRVVTKNGYTSNWVNQTGTINGWTYERIGDVEPPPVPGGSNGGTYTSEKDGYTATFEINNYLGGNIVSVSGTTIVVDTISVIADELVNSTLKITYGNSESITKRITDNTTTAGGQTTLTIDSNYETYLDNIYNYNATGGTFSSNYANSTAWTIFGDGANTEINDAVYFGFIANKWNNLHFNIGVAGVYTATLVHEFWNGSAWTSFTPIATTTDFKSTGVKSITWNYGSLTSWSSYTVNGVNAYWVRIRISAFTSWTTQPTQATVKVYRNAIPPNSSSDFEIVDDLDHFEWSITIDGTTPDDNVDYVTDKSIRFLNIAGEENDTIKAKVRSVDVNGNMSDFSAVESQTFSGIVYRSPIETEDLYVILNSLDVALDPADTAGVIVYRGTDQDAVLLFKENDDRWYAGLNGSESKIALLGVDETVSGAWTFPSLTLSNGGGLRTSTSAGNTLLLQAYDTDLPGYVTFATLTANTTPTMDLATGVTIGSAYIYRVSGTDVSLADGGTNASLTASNGGIVYSTASAFAILSGTATAQKILMSQSSTAPIWSTPTYPNLATSGKVLVGDGTNIVLSTPTFPNASATAGKIIISDGTNWIASTPTYPNASATAGKVLRSDGTNFVASTSTFADTYAVSTILYASSSNVVTGLATGNSSVLVTGGTGIPSLSTDIPTAVTIGSAYIYRVSGTDVAVADGGTAKSSWTQYAIPYLSATTTFSEITIGTANQVLGVTSAATGYEFKSVLGTSNQITVTHAVNSITLSTPQNIDTGASPTFKQLTLTQGTITSDAQILSMTSTWNSGATTFTLIKSNVTDTLSASGSLLIDLQVASASKFKADKSGNATFAGSMTSDSAVIGGGYGSTGVTISSAGNIQANGTLTIDSTALISGQLTADGGITADSGVFTVADTSGNIHTSGTLDVDSTSTFGNTITLDNATSNLINFGANGVAAPSDTSAGMKIKLYDSITANADYGIGIASNEFWFLTGITSGVFKWYQNAATPVLFMTLDGSGNLGVGVTPSVKAHVGGTSGELLRLEDNSATGNPFMTFFQTTTRRSWIQHNDTTDTLILASEYGEVAFKAASTLGSDTDTEYMRIGVGGNVKITSSVITGTGTSSSLSVVSNSLTSGNALSVSSSSLTTGNLISLISTSTAAGGNTQTVLNIATSGANATSTQTTYGQQITNTHTGTSSTNVALYLSASGGTNNYGLVVADGNVGIGTTSPGALLHLSSNSGSTPQFDTYSDTGGTTSQLLLRRAGGTAASPTAILSGMTIGTLGFRGYEQTTPQFTGNKASISAGAVENWTSTANGVELSFSTTASGSTTLTQRMVISNSGNVGINTTGPDRRLDILDASNPQLRLTYTDGTVYTDFQTTSSGYLYINPSGSRVGILTSAPTKDLALNGNSARTFWMERHTTAETAGNNLTVQAGGATLSASNKVGGDLYLSSGIATGTGSSNVYIQTATIGLSGTADRTPTTKMTVTSTGNVNINADAYFQGNNSNLIGYKTSDLAIDIGSGEDINIWINSWGNYIKSNDGEIRYYSATHYFDYNATNYMSLVVDSGGSVNIATVTSSAAGNFKLSPAGNVLFNPVGNQVDPVNNYDISLGQLSKKYLTLHAAELWVETLVAQDTIATIGGRVIVPPGTTVLIADLASGGTTIDVKHNQMQNGDTVILQANGKLEFISIDSNATAITGGYRYNVTRNLDGTGANQWYAGDAVVNTGKAGSGFHDLYSLESVNGRPPDFIYNYNNNGSASPYEAGVYSTSNYNSSSYWTLFGDNANSEIGDSIYFGVSNTTWSNLHFNIGTAAVYTATLVWEFWNNTTWTSFTPDTTTDFKSTGYKSVTWTAGNLTSWTAKSINSQTAYWVRVRISAFTSWTTAPIQATTRVYYQKQQYGPTHVIWKRNSSTWNDITEHAAFGQLSGLYGYSASTFGVAIGKYHSTEASSWLAMDETSGIKIVNRSSGSDTVVGQWKTTGEILVGQESSGQSNVQILSGAINLRNNTTNYIVLSSAGVITVGLTSAEHVLLDATSLKFKNSSTVYTELNAGVLTLGDTANEYVLVDTSGILLKDGSVIYGQFAATTTIGVTTTEHVSISSTSVQIKDGSTVWTDLTAGSLVLGQNANSNSRIAIDSTNGVQVIQKSSGGSDSTRIKLAVDGSGYLANTSVSWDTSGNFNIAGSAYIGGTTGWLISANTIASVTAGVKIYADATSQYIAMGSTVPTGLFVNNGIWMKSISSDAEFRVGEVNGTVVTTGVYWDGTNFKVRFNSLDLITATASVATIAGWSADNTYFWGLASGTPTSSPNDGVVLKSGSTGGLIVYEDTAKRVEVGYLSSGIYGLKGYATDGSTVIFELSDTQQKIAGSYFSNTDIWAGNSALNNAATKVVIGDFTDGGTPKIALGATADAITLTVGNGFYVDGSGYIRGGQVQNSMLVNGFSWNGSNYEVAGSLSVGRGGYTGSNFYAGRTNVNLCGYSDTVGTGTVNSNGRWQWSLYGSSNGTYDTLSTDSPRGITETVGRISRTTGTGDYRTQLNNLGDISSRTFTFSVWLRLQSGSGVTCNLAIAADDDTNSSGSTKTPTTSWQRFSFSKTFVGGLSQTGIRCYFSGISPTDFSATPIQMWGAQIEENSVPTIYQSTGEQVAYVQTNSAMPPLEYGMWATNGGFGGGIQNPVVKLSSAGIQIVSNQQAATAVTAAGTYIGMYSVSGYQAVLINSSGITGYTGSGTTTNFSLPTTGTARIASTYFNDTDIWAGNSAIGNVATILVLGDLTGANPKIALGATADSITLAGTEAGFLVEGQYGYFKFYKDTSNYLRGNASGLDIKSQTFSLATTGVTISSATLTSAANTIKISGGDTKIFVGSGITIDGATGGTITGGTIQTASSGQRIVLAGSDNTLRFYNATDEVITIDDDLSITMEGNVLTVPGIKLGQNGGVFISGLASSSAFYGIAVNGIGATADFSNNWIGLWVANESGQFRRTGSVYGVKVNIDATPVSAGTTSQYGIYSNITSKINSSGNVIGLYGKATNSGTGYAYAGMFEGVVRQDSVIRKIINVTGISDNTATTIFTVNTSSAQEGCYSVFVHFVVIHDGAVTDKASKSFTAQYTRAVKVSIGVASGVTSTITEVVETASAATTSATKDISTVTLTTTEVSETSVDAQITVDLTGSSVGTATVYGVVELVWSGFTTAPTIT